MRRGAAALAVLALLRCASEPAAAVVDVSASSSIARSADGASLWVTSPDDDRVLRVDADTLAVRETFAVPGAPSALVLVGDAVVVALDRRAAGVVMRAGDMSAVPIPCGGSQAVVALDATRVLAACAWDERVAIVDIARGATLRTVVTEGRPTAAARAGERVFVSASRTGRLRTWSRARLLGLGASTDVEALDTPVQLEADADVALETTPGVAASQVDAVAAMALGGAPVAVWQRVERDADRSLPADRGGYGSVHDDAPRIEPRVLAACGGRYARFDGGPSVASGPSALAWAAGRLWIANRYTDTVVVLDCAAGEAGSPRTGFVPRLATFRTGRGPRGIALAPDGRRAWVDTGFDHAVELLDLDAPARTDPRDATRSLRRDLGPLAPAAQLLAGRSLFHDAVNTHLTPSGVVTCATCHPDGGDDGLTWFLHTTNVPRKLRRTPPAWGARAELAPFHWDGGFTDAEALTRTTLAELMGGDGLVVDTAAMVAWMASVPPRPPRPLTPLRSAAAARGQALFARADVGCATCHGGPDLPDRLRHAVLPATSDADATLAEADTPSLRGVHARSPHLHDGRAATLRDVLTTQNAGDTHGHTSQLAAADVDDLVVYLESL